MAIFFLQKFVISNIITDFFLVEQWKIRACKKVRLQKYSAKCFDRNSGAQLGGGGLPALNKDKKIMPELSLKDYEIRTNEHLKIEQW